jgi:hypothetical protein
LIVQSIYVVGCILILLSMVQSVFGMGVLVFGTPTLLLLGFDFANVLGWLLPSSLAISSLQVLGGIRSRDTWSALPQLRVGLVCVPLLAALSCILVFKIKASIDLWIGFTMLSAALLRQSDWLKSRFSGLVQRNENIYLMLMGLVHGSTNMGGALLALYASATSVDKQATRLQIARYYLLFGSVQVMALLAFKRSALTLSGFMLAPIAALVYIAVGNTVFNRAGAALYERAFTAFIAAYGVAVLGKVYYL